MVNPMQLVAGPGRSSLRLGSLACVLLLCSASATGAIPGLTGSAPAAAAPAEATAKTPAVEPIATGDIPMRADIDERFAEDVVVRAQGKDPSKTLRIELEALAAGIAKLSKVAASEDLRHLSVIRLESLENH